MKWITYNTLVFNGLSGLIVHQKSANFRDVRVRNEAFSKAWQDGDFPREVFLVVRRMQMHADMSSNNSFGARPTATFIGGPHVEGTAVRRLRCRDLSLNFSLPQ
jgi:hypothetical protein